MSSETHKPSIVYMGTPYFAVPPLQALYEAGYKILAVITVADKPAGRGQKLTQSPVKQYAIENGLSCIQPTNLKDEEFFNELRKLGADLFVVVAFRMLPKVIWSMPPMGTFNLHGSLLPKYRGAAPINWAVINGEKETGLTTFLLDEKIDTGAILARTHYQIPEGSTAGEVHDALMPLGAELVLRTVQLLASGSAQPLPQSDDEATEAPKLFKDNTELDFNRNPKELVQMIKGLSPFPSAHYCGYKFLNAEETQEQHPSAIPVLRKESNCLILDYPLGSLEITLLKPSGKRAMTAVEFLNGLRSDIVALE
jgi:methionyl-tRNA formyltransferase